MALPSFTDDFPAWYQEVVRQADLAENSLVRGTMVIKPYGYALWEAIRDALDVRFKETGHQNLYFPMFIPLHLMEREKAHVEGFAHEFVQVTRVGSEELAEPLVVRPSSETIIWQTYAKWVQSYRDLPLLYNQWANIVRWELRPRLFLRTTEFLWQEGHTAHETKDEAWAEAKQMLEAYREVAEDVMAMPVHVGRKTPAERFPGAEETLTIEALMRDRKALQAGTSHYLGQNFAKAYGMQFLGRDGEARRRSRDDPRRRARTAAPSPGRPDPGGGRPDLPERRRAVPRAGRDRAARSELASGGSPREGRRPR
jgi:prolyl-tRNA synthetase